MSEMVLRLPNSYIEVEMDEMEYVDGGFSMQTVKSWGIPRAASLHFSNGDLWALSVGGATMAGILAIWCPDPIISKVVATALLVAAGGVGIAAAYGKQLSVSWVAGYGITQFKFY